MVKKGERYRHFKGMIVEVLYIAKDSETEEDLVVYKHINDDNVWVRPYEMFTSKVDKEKYPNVLQEYRFELVNDYD